MLSKLQQIPILNLTLLIVVSLVALFLLYKISEGIFLDFLSNESKKNRNGVSNLDQLIQMQKMLIGSKGNSAEVKKNNINRTEEAYVDLFQKTTDEKLRKDLQLVFKILDSAKWGEGDFLRQVILQLDKCKIQVAIAEVSRVLNKLLRSNYFLDFSPLPSAQKILELVCINLAYESLNESGEEYVKSKKISFSDLRFGLEQINAHDFYKLEDFLTALAMRIESLKILKPIDIMISKEPQKAHKFFGTSDKSTFDEIKKNYKLVINLRHPDKIDTKSLSAKELSIINDNFNIVQTAYELIAKR
jgi:DnaJ-domain-containing protein 1